MNANSSLGPYAQHLKEGYTKLWSAFAAEMSGHTSAIQDWAAGTEALHPFLRDVQWTPKEFLRVATKVGEQTPNVGSATGLFFEHVAAAAIGARIQARTSANDFAPANDSEVTCHRNRLSPHFDSKGTPKQPDLFLFNKVTGRAVVFEFKTSPKSDQLEGIRDLKRRWERDAGVQFFLVVGYADGTVASCLADYAWASVLRTKDNGPAAHTVDTLVEAAVRHLAAV